MSIKIKTAAVTAGFALMAVPAYGAGQQPTSTPPGYNGSTNPGTQYQPTSTPPGYNGSTNPGTQNQPGFNGSTNSSTPNTPSQSQARALGVKECQSFKTNFKDNKQAFGKCIAAVAQSIHSNTTPAQACSSKRLSKSKHDGQARSDFKACVLAATKAQHAVQHP
jgi:hypothetical protein